MECGHSSQLGSKIHVVPYKLNVKLVHHTLVYHISLKPRLTDRYQYFTHADSNKPFKIWKTKMKGCHSDVTCRYLILRWTSAVSAAASDFLHSPVTLVRLCKSRRTVLTQHSWNNHCGSHQLYCSWHGALQFTTRCSWNNLFPLLLLLLLYMHRLEWHYRKICYRGTVQR